MDVVTRRYEDSIKIAQQLGDVYAIRFDYNKRTWADMYADLMEAFRSLSNSRILRRLNISGFRFVNINTTAKNNFTMFTDTWVVGLTESTHVIEKILKKFSRAEKQTIRVHYVSRHYSGSVVRNMIHSHDRFNRLRWRVEEFAPGILEIIAPSDDVAFIIRELPFFAPIKLNRVEFVGRLLDLYAANKLPDNLHERHCYNDITVFIDDKCLRRYTRFGKMKLFKTF